MVEKFNLLPEKKKHKTKGGTLNSSLATFNESVEHSLAGNRDMFKQEETKEIAYRCLEPDCKPDCSSLWCLTVSLSLSHGYPGSGVVLDFSSHA